VIVIKSKDVLRNGVNLSTCDRANAAHLDGDAGTVMSGMLLVNMTGVVTLGRTAVVPETGRTAVVSVDVSAWRVDEATIPAEYIALFLNSPAGIAQTIRFQTGSSRQLHLYPEHIRNLWIFVRRTGRGEMDTRWHEQLACDARAASEARLRATDPLQNLHGAIAAAIGLNPRVYRE
jgi:hypothetical protein